MSMVLDARRRPAGRLSRSFRQRTPAARSYRGERRDFPPRYPNADAVGRHFEAWPSDGTSGETRLIYRITNSKFPYKAGRVEKRPCPPPLPLIGMLVDQSKEARNYENAEYCSGSDHLCGVAVMTMPYPGIG